MKKIINYDASGYPCLVLVNKHWFTKLEISQYYRTKPGRATVSDEKIVELVKQLHGKRGKRVKNDYYNYEPLYIDYRAYNLVWDYDEKQPTKTLLIINCYREKKYDKK